MLQSRRPFERGGSMEGKQTPPPSTPSFAPSQRGPAAPSPRPGRLRAAPPRSARAIPAGGRRPASPLRGGAGSLVDDFEEPRPDQLGQRERRNLVRAVLAQAEPVDAVLVDRPVD